MEALSIYSIKVKNSSTQQIMDKANNSIPAWNAEDPKIRTTFYTFSEIIIIRG